MSKIILNTVLILTGTIIAAGTGYLIRDRSAETERMQTIASVEDYVKGYYQIERYIIESYPIYQDWAGPEKESALRKYLLKDHLEIADRLGLKPLRDDSDIKGKTAEGRLISLTQNTDTPYFFYNVPAKYRFLQPVTAGGLNRIAERFNTILKERMKDREVPEFTVKFAVSSAVRPVRYQNELREVNPNASYISSHSYGASFDIFYDTFFVAREMPRFEPVNERTQSAASSLRTRLGYVTGDALRRQFRAMLAETLLQMQNEGILYAILERNQRCFHVTILPVR